MCGRLVRRDPVLGRARRRGRSSRSQAQNPQTLVHALEQLADMVHFSIRAVGGPAGGIGGMRNAHI